jgi:hypothetical protein
MGSALGIAALIVALAAVAVPLATLYIVWAALVLATVAAFAGSRLFALGAALVSLANLALLNPSPWTALAWEPSSRCVWLQTVTSVLFLSPVAASLLSFGKEGADPVASRQRTEAHVHPSIIDRSSHG